MCARITTLKSEPLHFADGLHHHEPPRHGLAVLLPAGLVRITAHALSPSSPLTIMALHVVKLYVMYMCKGQHSGQ